jgi:hypothetical protein
VSNDTIILYNYTRNYLTVELAGGNLPSTSYHVSKHCFILTQVPLIFSGSQVILIKKGWNASAST